MNRRPRSDLTRWETNSNTGTPYPQLVWVDSTVTSITWRTGSSIFSASAWVSRSASGDSSRGLAVARPNSQVRLASYGILELTLGNNNFSWRFVSVNNAVLDSGSGPCH